MTEWGVFGVVVALISFVVAVAAPMLKLNGTITRLSTIIEQFSKRLDKLEQDDEASRSSNREARRRIHERIDGQEKQIAEHDKKLANHELRLNQLEERKQ